MGNTQGKGSPGSCHWGSHKVREEKGKDTGVGGRQLSLLKSLKVGVQRKFTLNVTTDKSVSTRESPPLAKMVQEEVFPPRAPKARDGQGSSAPKARNMNG